METTHSYLVARARLEAALELLRAARGDGVAIEASTIAELEALLVVEEVEESWEEAPHSALSLGAEEVVALSEATANLESVAALGVGGEVSETAVLIGELEDLEEMDLGESQTPPGDHLRSFFEE